MPHCEATYAAQTLVGEVCNVNEVSSVNIKMVNLISICQVGGCGQHQRCAQEQDGERMGKCECLSAYTVKSDRTCVDRTIIAQVKTE